MMTQERYKVVFQGEIDDGCNLAEVKKNLCTMFNTESDHIERLFTKPRVVLKRDVDYPLAMKYKTALKNIGALCYVEAIAGGGQADEQRGGAGQVAVAERDAGSPEATPAVNLIVCRKCGFEQPAAEACLNCGILVKKYVERPIVREMVRPEPIRFYAQIPSAFSYPLLGKGKFTLVAGAVFFGLLRVAGLFGFIITGYVCAYMMRIIASSANGDETLPDWPDFSNFWDDIIRPYLLMLGIVIFSAIPALAYMFSGSYAVASDPVLLIALLVVGALYLPMGLIAVSIFNSITALNPLLIIPATFSVLSDYVVAIGLLLLVGLVGSIDTSHLLPIPIVGALVGHLIAFYLLMVEMRILGLLYYANEDRIGWFA